jgi:hypothetical protein
MTRVARAAVTAAAALAAIWASSGAIAAPTLIIRHAAMNLVVQTEDRSDIAVEVYRPNARLPLDVQKVGSDVVIDGHLISFLTSCHGSGEGLRVMVFGRGDYDVQHMPQVLVRTPRDVVVDSGGVVRAAITRSHSVILAASGCGDWTVANVEGRLDAHLSGVGDLRSGSSNSASLGMSGAGHMQVGLVATSLSAHLSGAGGMTVRGAGSADLAISGSGGMATGPIRGGLTARLSGAGDLKVASVAGPVSADVSGVGNIDIQAGQASSVDAEVSGTGHIDFHGVADSLNASVSGVGSVDVDRVTGPVVQHVSGIGSIHIGER